MNSNSLLSLAYAKEHVHSWHTSPSFFDHLSQLFADKVAVTTIVVCIGATITVLKSLARITIDS